MELKSVQLFAFAIGIVTFLNFQLFVSCEIIEIRNSQEWDRRIHQQSPNGTLTVVQFYVPWCGYCQYMKPKFIQIAADHPDVIFLNVNADDQRTLAWRYSIRSVPTYKYFRSGLNIDSITTWQPSVINDLINRLKN